MDGGPSRISKGERRRAGEASTGIRVFRFPSADILRSGLAPNDWQMRALGVGPGLYRRRQLGLR